MDINKSRKIFLFKCKNCNKLSAFFSPNLSLTSYCKFCLKKNEKEANCDVLFLYEVVLPPFFIYTIDVNYHYFKYGILIKPTKKTFYDYSFKDSLHIGVINKRNGIVYSFWNNGINKEGASIEWIGCVETFNLIETNKSKNMDNFLLLCGSFFENNMYDCNTWNCFDFVLAFLNYYGYPIRFLSKEVFIRKVIYPILYDTLRYCRLSKSINL